MAHLKYETQMNVFLLFSEGQKHHGKKIKIGSQSSRPRVKILATSKIENYNNNLRNYAQINIYVGEGALINALTLQCNIRPEVHIDVK